MSEKSQNWEYTSLKIVTKECFPAGTLDQTLVDSRLNQLGKEGWELVSVFDASIVNETAPEIVAVLKRLRRRQPLDTQLHLRTLLPDSAT